MADCGNLYIIAAPSGTGKTTLVNALLEAVPKLAVSISHTTRPKRATEKNAIHYYFIDQKTFEKHIHENDFLEYAKIFDHYYGTSKKAVEETLAKGIDVILEIDWQGHQQIKKLFPESIGIFILPPSLGDLQTRLVKRDQDHPEIIARRLADVKEAVSHINEFDYIVVNDEFMHALDDLKLVILAGRLLKKRQLQRYELLINDLQHLQLQDK